MYITTPFFFFLLDLGHFFPLLWFGDLLCDWWRCWWSLKKKRNYFVAEDSVYDCHIFFLLNSGLFHNILNFWRTDSVVIDLSKKKIKKNNEKGRYEKKEIFFKYDLSACIFFLLCSMKCDLFFLFAFFKCNLFAYFILYTIHCNFGLFAVRRGDWNSYPFPH